MSQTEHDPWIPSEALALFFPRVDEARLEAEAHGAGIEFGGGDPQACAERCPRCGADPGELCRRRGKPVDPHFARFQVSLLRYERAWVPKPGEPVRFGDGVGTHALFVEFTERGEARVEIGGKRVAFEATALYPAGGPR